MNQERVESTETWESTEAWVEEIETWLEEIGKESMKAFSLASTTEDPEIRKTAAERFEHLRDGIRKIECHMEALGYEWQDGKGYVSSPMN